MKEVLIFHVDEGQPHTLRVKVVDSVGTLIAPTGISSISYKVFLLPDGTEVSGTGGSLTVGSVLFSSLQPWEDAEEGDSDGYNFRHEIPGASFPNATATDERYRIEYTFTPTGGGASFVPVKTEAICNEIYSVV
jgi:hypothetical protein